MPSSGTGRRAALLLALLLSLLLAAWLVGVVARDAPKDSSQAKPALRNELPTAAGEARQVLAKTAAKQSSPSGASVEDMFANRDDTPGQVGGVLVHMMSIEAAAQLADMAPLEVNLNDDWVCDCGPVGAASCSAWTYLRSDLMPVIFAKPSGWESKEGASSPLYSTPICGVIVDPNRIWPLLTNMGVVDSGTNDRNCCASERDWVQSSWFACSPEDSKDAPPGALSFALQYDGACAVGGQCAENDVWCKRMHSGGGVIRTGLGCTSLGCPTARDPVGNNWGCDQCAARGDDARPSAGACRACAMVHACATASEPLGSQDTRPFATHNRAAAWAPQYVDLDARELGNLVGEEAGAFKRLFANDAGELRDTFEISSNMCRFAPSQWAQFVGALKEYYRAWLTAYQTPADLRAEWAVGRNYMLANPDYWMPYLENEVNLYAQPKSGDPLYAAQARRQSDAFRDSIVGFFYVGKTCLELHADLEGVSSQFTDPTAAAPESGGGTTYAAAKDRCDGYFGSDTLAEAEYQYIERARVVVRKLVDKFNSTYRRDGHPVAAYKYVGDTNTYFKRRSLQKVLNEGGVTINDVFIRER